MKTLSTLLAAWAVAILVPAGLTQQEPPQDPSPPPAADRGGMRPPAGEPPADFEPADEGPGPIPEDHPGAGEDYQPAPTGDSPAIRPARGAASAPAPAARPAARPATLSPTMADARDRAARRLAAQSAVTNTVEEAPLRLNFRGAPLDLVLDYLSEAAGFIIILETEVKGKLDVWSNQPLTRTEAVELLNQVLAKNGYAALQEGRTLTILTQDEARRRNTPVRSGNDPETIPFGDQIITQIIPVRFVNAVQLSRDLTPLFPPTATIAANEGGNALVVTDTQSNIRRIAEIIRALDTAISSVSAVRVFPLQYADAKALATVVRDLFAAQNARSTGNQQQTVRGFRGPGGMQFPGMPGGGGNQGGQNAGGGSSRVSTPGVVAVADERSNSLVVSAPEEQMPIIEDLVREVDTDVDDITELRVFRLRHSDAQEMADLIKELFPDATSSQNQGGRGQIRFGGGPFGGGMAALQSGESSRLQKQSRVLAVPDLRTQSVVVTAARDIMVQVAQMIEQLDADNAKKQEVYMFSVENTDPTVVEEILRGLFETQNTRNRTTTTRNTQQTGRQLNTRATTTQQNMGRGNTGFGSFGTSGGGTGR